MKLAFSLILSLGYLVSSPVNVTAAQPPKAHELTHEYSFEQYIIDFNKEAIYYSQDVTLYPSKKHNFESNLRRILEHNSNVQYDLKTGKRKEDDESRNGHTYHMGVNQFMDLSQDEITSLYFGYDKKSTLHKGFIQAKDDDEDKIILKNVNDDETDHKMELPFNITDIDTLPLSINYASNKTITTPVKNQGACGSCWAFSSIAALESHLAIQTNQPANILSTQELVSCVSNPSHCGGTGGCEGATAEIAYNYVANNGIVKEESFPYKATDMVLLVR